MSKRVIALVLVGLMVLACFAGCGQKKLDNPSKDLTKVVLGDTTELSGDFRWPGFGGSSAGAADQNITKLTVGYATMESDQNGTYQWSKTAVKSHEEKEIDHEDGKKTFLITIEINPGLKFSDGTEVKAANYVASILSFSTKVSVGAKHTGKSGQAFVGYNAFYAYDGTNDGVEDEKSGVKASKVFSGIRLLGDYKFSMEIDSDFYPYYYADTYGAVSPDPLGLALGDGIEVKDDGDGCYLSDAFYAKVEGKDEYKQAAVLAANRFDVTKYPFSGAYTISEWDEGKKEATLKLNPNFAGDFAGQKPSIETVVYVKVVSETQLESLKQGAVDVLFAITGGDDVNAALKEVNLEGGYLKETHYQRAGYGKVEFECDFGPTYFQEVRQAVTYLLKRDDFCSTFTGGYGVVVEGPYSPDFSMYKAVKDTIKLNKYDFSVDNAIKVLEEGGWVYNSKGETYVAGQSGVDAVRYKKLSGRALTEDNKNYASVANTDGVTYKTVKVGDDYYMPLVINWFGTTPNDVTDLLTTTLANSKDVANAGMVIRATAGDFTTLLGNIYRDPSYGYTGTPTYGMFNLATGWNSSIYDYAFNWSLDEEWFGNSANKLYDDYDYDFPYYDADGNHTKMTYDEAVKASGGKLGMDYLSMAMVYDVEPGDTDSYNQWWEAYIERWNELMPDIPLYSNVYYDVYNEKIDNFVTTPFWSPARAIIYASISDKSGK